MISTPEKFYGNLSTIKADIKQGQSVLLLRYGAVDASAVFQANTAELRSSITETIQTAENRARMVAFAKDYLTVIYGKTLDSNLSETEKNKRMEEYKARLTDEDIAATLEKAFENSTEDAILSTVEPKGRLHDAYLIKDMLKEKTIALTEEQMEKLKEMIQTEGVVMVGHTAPVNVKGGVQGDDIYRSTGEVEPFGK